MRTLAFAAACLIGCNGSGSGSLELTLTLPTQPDLKPTGMTTVTVTATPPGESPIATTSVLSTMHKFAAGDLPVGPGVQIGVVLRDVSNRIVGVGEAGQTVDIVGDKATQISIPVRRPFVYASSAGALYSFDPTLDPRDAKFQGKLAGVASPLFTVSVGGDRLAVVSNNQVQVVVTATNTVLGSISVPAGVTDATAVPGTHKLAVAHASGIAIVDLDAGMAVNATVGPVDRVTVGPGADGLLYAYGLVGRVVPPENPPPLATCSGTSSIVAVSVDTAGGETVRAPIALGAAISDLAAAPDNAMLFATAPCTGKVVSIKGDVTTGGALTLTDVAPLERAAVLTVSADRIWAAGTRATTIQCSTATGACLPTTPLACPQPTSGAHVAFAVEGAGITVLSIPLGGGTPITLDVPGRRETIFDKNDAAKQHAQVLKALSTLPLDLVALPGSQYVALVTKSRYYIEQLDNGVQIILPCLDATTGDWLLLDAASASIAQRVRTACNLTVGPADIFTDWECDAPPDGEGSDFGDYMPTSVGALFGAR